VEANTSDKLVPQDITALLSGERVILQNGTTHWNG
jgi:hypothetical protein